MNKEIIIETANDENDDWLQKAYPEKNKKELKLIDKIFDDIIKRKNIKEKGNGKE